MFSVMKKFLLVMVLGVGVVGLGAWTDRVTCKATSHSRTVTFNPDSTHNYCKKCYTLFCLHHTNEFHNDVVKGSRCRGLVVRWRSRKNR
jgi:hypothetical protein